MQAAKEDEELKECTFTPVMQTDKDQKKRTKVFKYEQFLKEEFIQSQQKFLQDKEEKRKKA